MKRQAVSSGRKLQTYEVIQRLWGDFCTFGLLFEALCIRDLRIYAGSRRPGSAASRLRKVACLVSCFHISIMLSSKLVTVIPPLLSGGTPALPGRRPACLLTIADLCYYGNYGRSNESSSRILKRTLTGVVFTLFFHSKFMSGNK